MKILVPFFNNIYRIYSDTRITITATIIDTTESLEALQFQITGQNTKRKLKTKDSK